MTIMKMIKIFVAMSEEQAKEEGRTVCISPGLTDSRRAFLIIWF